MTYVKSMKLYLPPFLIALLLLCAFPLLSRGQSRRQANASAEDSEVIRIGIWNFKKLQGSQRADVLEEALPQLLRMELYSQKWLVVTLIGKTLAGSAEVPANQRDAAHLPVALDKTLDLTIEGEIIELSDNQIRVDIKVNDVLRHGTVFSDSIYSETRQLVPNMTQFADKMANALREKVLLTKTGSHPVVVVGPFDNKIANPELSFLGSSLPLKISENSDKTVSRKNLICQPVFPGAAPSGGNWDIRITGEISQVGNSLLVSGSYQEPSGLTFPFQQSGPLTEPLKVVDGFSQRAWEILLGRVAPSGGLRPDNALLSHGSADQLLARGLEYEKAGDDDAALFMYGMAIRQKGDSAEARLKAAEIYRNREAYDDAEAQYRQVLAQNSQSAAAHLGLGILQSKRGKYESAVQELQGAFSLASTDAKLQFEACMRLGDVFLLMDKSDLAIEQYQKAEALDKSSVAPVVSLAKSYRSKNDLDNAIRSLRNGLERWPNDNNLKNDLASALNAFGKREKDAKNSSKAFDFYQQTIDLNPPDTQVKAAAYLQAGMLLVWDLNDLPKGIGYLEKCTELEPNNELNFRALGFAYHNAGREKEAIEKLRAAIKITPVFQSYYELGLIYLLTGDYGSGLDCAKKAVDLDDKAADGYLLVGALYEHKFAKSTDDKESFRLATEYLNQAIQRDAKNEAGPRILAVLYRDAGDYPNAVLRAKQAIALEPTAWAYDVLASSESKLKQTDAAVAALMEGLKLDRRYDAFYDQLEDIYSATKQEEKFVQLLKETIALQPDYLYPYIKLGILARDQEHFDEAIDWLEKAAKIDPKSEWAQRVMGFTYSRMGRSEGKNPEKSKAAFENAVAHLDRAIQLSPTAWAYAELGSVHTDLGQYKEAIEDLESAIRLNPEYETAFVALENVYDKQGRGDDFNSFLETIVAKNPGFYWAQSTLARRYKSLGRFDQALDHASKAVELQPDDAVNLERLAWAEQSKKELDKAYGHARKAVDLEPKNSDAIRTLVSILFEQKKYEQAVRELNALLTKNGDSVLVLSLTANAHRLDKKSLPEAFPLLQKAIKIDPKYYYARFVLSECYADQGKHAEAVASAKEALKAWPDSAWALQVLYLSSHQLGKDSEVLQYLEQSLAEHPQSSGLLEAVGFVTHEYTKDYQRAYETYKKVYDQNPKNWAYAENFAEASLTAGHIDEVLSLTNDVRSDPDASIQSKLTMKMLQIAAFLLRGEQGRAFAELGVFRDEYGSVPKDYARGWTYSGTKSFVQANAALKPVEKVLLTNMIDLLEAPQDRAKAQLDKFEASFAETYAELKAAGPSGGERKK